MSPLSLLFSSGEETSRVLGQALRELEFQVDHCPEIFSAVERLTARKLELLVADWDDGLEASFLLKTSRELKANGPAFALAIVSTSESEIAAKQLRADLVLRKPFTSDQVKYALLSCDVFLARMREWVPRVEPQRSSFSDREATSANRIRSGEDSAVVDSKPQGFAKRNSFANRPDSVLGRYQKKSRNAVPARANRFLIASIATTLLACGYVVHDAGGIRPVLASASSFMTRWLPSVHPAPLASSAEATIQVPDLSLPPLSAVPVQGTHIRVTPAHRSPIQPPEQQVASGIALSGDQLAATSQHESTPRIPESLKVTEPLLQAASPSSTPTLLEGLEPVSLTEELSQNLLVERVQPSYPEQALRAGVQGSVVLQAWIGTDGRIQSLKLVQGSFLLGEAAYRAVKQWRYRPYLLHGHAVQAQTFVTVDFNLPIRSSATLPASGH